MNKVMLMGRLTKDPDVRYTQGENPLAVSRFTLAVDRRFKRDGQQTADFISCKAFGKTAEFSEKYLRKGSKIAVEGRIETGSYTNKEGNTVYTTEVVLENIEFAESKAANSAAPQQATGGTATQQPQGVVPSEDDFMSIPDGIDEELPFN